MPTTVILDEWQLTFRIPTDLPDADVDAIRRVLDDPQFLARLRAALRRVLRADPELTPVRVTAVRRSGSAGGRLFFRTPWSTDMKALGDLLVGLAMLAVLLAAAFGLWAAVVPDTAKAARDRTVRAVDRLTEDDRPAASTAGTAVPRRPAR